MIISEYRDISTNKVIDWLRSQNKNVFRINFEEKVEINYSIDNLSESIFLRTDNWEVDLKYITSYYYRRGDIKYRYNLVANSFFYDKINSYFSKEWSVLKRVVYDYPFQIKIGNHYSEVESNKLVDIQLAKKAGLQIPNSISTSNKQTLLDFRNNSKYDDILIKPLFSNVYIHSRANNMSITNSSNYGILTDDILNTCPDNFFPIIAQEYIDKKYEIRIFFIKDQLFPMAIFSQSDSGSKFDFRAERIDGNESRSVPYKLSDENELKIRNFIQLSNLTTGSIDLLISRNGNLIFLEVNPAGQFDWVSGHCNYYIEKKIAELL